MIEQLEQKLEQRIGEYTPMEMFMKDMQYFRYRVFEFIEERLGLAKADCLDELKGKKFKIKDSRGDLKSVMLFDEDGDLVHYDLKAYKKYMFKHQDKQEWNKHCKGKQITWQQTLEVEAYRRGLLTFDKDSYDQVHRKISIRSGHGIGKSSYLSIICLHFLLCFEGGLVGATANTQDQLEDILMKEFYFWRKRLPEYLSNQIQQVQGMIRVGGQKDWYLRARVSSKDKPEALAGLHAPYVMLIVDEASGVPREVFEVMYGALTGENWIVVYTGNPTRPEGEFFDSHNKNKRLFQHLHFDSLESPIVKDAFLDEMREKYGEDSDEWKVRVTGDFPSTSEMDEKGWIPLFANVPIIFEVENSQILRSPLIGVDPAGQGRDKSVINVRDQMYLKTVLYEKTSTDIDLARKIETFRDAYETKTNDIGIDAFGIGAKVVAQIRPKHGEFASVNAILADKPRDEVKHLYASYKAELAWRFREWLLKGGIIITNNKQKWLDEMQKIKYKRDRQGRILLMPKTDFVKEHGFSPDRFDASLYTMFQDEPTRETPKTTHELEQLEQDAWNRRSQDSGSVDDYSSM